MERSLGPEKYHSRLPWFAKVTTAGVRIDGGTQAVMDQEISFAASAGLDYWAFLLYPEGSSMSQSLKNYLRSSKRTNVSFCVILHNSFGVPEVQWPKELARVVGLLKEPGYQTVLDRRPLVYAFGLGLQGVPERRFSEFRRAANAAGYKPYCVYMGWDPASDYARASAKGFDAVSAYAFGSANETFTQLSQAVEKQYWQAALKAKVPYIPLVTTGWDKRPRKEHPVSWEKDHAYHKQEVFPSMATLQEIASHLGNSLQFVANNREVCVANAIIVYAWNEHDEGGWIVPTWTPDGKPNTERIDALSKVLKARNSLAQPLK